MQINHSLSRLSVLSNARSNHSKHSPSTQPQESPEQHSSNSNQAFELDYPSQRFNKLENEIERIEKAQSEMEAKYNRYIQHMLQEIQRNNENNARLAKEVGVLAQQIEESKKDILIIDEFLSTKTQKKQSKAQPQNQLKLQPRRQSSRAQFGSSSRSKNLLLRRTPSKNFKSKLTFKA